MIPARHAPILLGLVLSGLMSLIVSGIATLRAAGLGEGVAALWMGSWVSSWAVAFPTVLVAGPLARRVVARLMRPAAPPRGDPPPAFPRRSPTGADGPRG